MKFDRISFAEAGSDALREKLASLTEAEREEADEIILYYLSVDSEISFLFSLVGKCLLVRSFDGAQYCFVFPHELSEQSNIYEAVCEIVKYSVIEEISPIFVSVPQGDVRVFFDLGYRHIDCDADSEDASSYRITLKNECSFLDELPTEISGEYELSAISEADGEEYASLVFDEENNRYWGYDCLADYGEVSRDFLLELAAREFSASSAISLAVRHRGAFVGEAVIHAFDFKGGADISVRIIPEEQNKGHGKAALSLLLALGERIGLTELRARVYSENLPSLSLFGSIADKKTESDGVVVFGYEL